MRPIRNDIRSQDVDSDSLTHLETHTGLAHKYKVVQRAMDRAKLGVCLFVKIRNEVIRRRTRVTDIAKRKCSTIKFKWAGHVSR